MAQRTARKGLFLRQMTHLECSSSNPVVGSSSSAACFLLGLGLRKQIIKNTAAPGGHLKLPHRWAGQTPPPDGGGTRDDYAV